jgi:hypothetical protein
MTIVHTPNIHVSKFAILVDDTYWVTRFCDDGTFYSGLRKQDARTFNNESDALSIIKAIPDLKHAEVICINAEPHKIDKPVWDVNVSLAKLLKHKTLQWENQAQLFNAEYNDFPCSMKRNLTEDQQKKWAELNVMGYAATLTPNDVALLFSLSIADLPEEHTAFTVYSTKNRLDENVDKII